MRSFRRFLIFSFALGASSAASAYDRSASVNYASGWWNTLSNIGSYDYQDKPPAFLRLPPNHINISSYAWYYHPNHPNDKQSSFTQTNSNSAPAIEDNAADCANFVSAALITGGIRFSGPDGIGKTVTNAARLGCELSDNIATEIYSLQDVPANLSPGDVVIFDNGSDQHAMLVSSGNGPNVFLMAHGTDRQSATLQGELQFFKYAVAYHIVSDTASSNCPLEAVNMTITDPNGNQLADGSYTNATEITVSGPTIASLDVMTGSPALDSDEDVVSGLAQVVAQYGPGSPYSIDLSSLQSGTTAYIVAFDQYGNDAVQSLIIDTTTPDCSVSTAALTCSDSASGLCAMSEEDLDTGQTFTQNIPPGVNSYTVDYNSFPLDGNYTDPAVDCAGNVAPPLDFAIQREQGDPAFNDFQNSALADFFDSIQDILPGDPNEMFGPSGQVQPGQTMNYVAQFENTGQGTAYGVYVTDVLDPSLDDTTLSVGNFQAINFVAGSTTTTTYPYQYDPTTRTVTIFPGTIDPSQGGQMTISAKLKSVPQGTIISNHATVYFPTVFQVTPTNAIVSIVPTPTQLVYTGPTTANFSDQALLTANLTAGGIPISGKTINFSINGATASAVTSSSGTAFSALGLALAPSSYTLTASFPGDGFYYLGSTQTLSFGLSKETVLMTPPGGTSGYPGTVSSTVTLTSDERTPLLNQQQTSRTIYLDAYQNGSWQTLAQGLLQGTTAQLSFTMFKPAALTTPIRARFDGDADYQGSVSTGVVVLIDTTPPSVSIQSPQGGTFSQGQAIRVQFQVADNLDPAPVSTAVFQSLITGSTAAAVNGSSIAAANLSTGTWVLRVTASDWAGNTTIVNSSSFAVVALTLPPRTTLTVEEPQFPGGPSSSTFVSNQTSYTLSSIDDLNAVGDGKGPGVAFQELFVDGIFHSSFTNPSPAAGQTFISTFTLSFSSSGLHTLTYFAQDVAGNVESPHVSTVAVDIIPPVSSLSIGTPLFEPSSSTIFVSSETFFVIASTDPLVGGVESGVKDSFFNVASSSAAVQESSFTVYSESFTLPGPDGVKFVSFYSEDNVLNAEAVKSSTVSLDLTPPVTQLNFAGGTQFSTPSVSGVYASSTTFIVLSATDPVVNGVASGVAFTQFEDDGSAFQIYSSSFNLSEGAHFLGYQSEDQVQNLEVLRSTTVLIDATPPVTTIAVGSPTYTSPSGTVYVSTYAPISLAAADPPLPQISTGLPAFPGSGVALTEIAIDTNVFSVYTGSFSLAEGIHVILYRSIDHVGNIEAAHQIEIESDGTPPVSSLSIGYPQFALSSTTLLVSSITPFVIVSTDPVSNQVASGVQNSFFKVSIGSFAVSNSSFTVFSASFTLSPPDGYQTVSFYSEDHVLNTEIAKSSSVILDSTPPTLALLSPASCEFGICRVVKGKFPVLGSVYDLYFASYTLSFAPGQNASSGFTMISSGSVNVSSGTLGIWDASGISGWQTLRLFASDLLENTNSVEINVFVGDPGELMILGNDDVFNLPEAAAVGPSGNIDVADTNAGRIEVFSSTGALLESFGTRPNSNGDDAAASTSTLTLNKPAGIAADSSGNLYVADTNDDRVLQLSTSGQVLMQIGGDGKNLFNHPSGLALDTSGDIYVSDTDNHRIEIFNSSGAFINGFDLPPIPHFSKGNGEGAKRTGDHARSDLGTPFGIAVDAARNVYVADPKGGRALVFTTTGQLLLEIPIAAKTEENGKQRKEKEDGGKNHPPLSGDFSSDRGEPFGVAVSTGGNCILVSDRKSNRVLRFDRLGDEMLDFGKFGQIPDDKNAPQKIVFHKPMGLALDSAGSLYVADRDNDRIEKFSLPTSSPTLVMPPPGPEDAEIARGVVDKNLGGKVHRPDKTGVGLPAGALLHDLQISVSSVTAKNLPQLDLMAHAAQTAGLTPAYAPVDFGPEGTVFQTSATLTLPYDPALLAQAGLEDDDLKIRWWNSQEGVWQDLESSVDKTNHLVTARTGHFSLYQVLAGTSSTKSLLPQGAPTAFQFVDLYAFPNPAKGAQYPDIRVQVGLADSVDIHIYDISGRLIKTTTVNNPVQLDDGNGKGLQYTFDYLWNTGNVGSGVYIYVITAHKAGQSNISRTKKLAVIR